LRETLRFVSTLSSPLLYQPHSSSLSLSSGNRGKIGARLRREPVQDSVARHLESSFLFILLLEDMDVVVEDHPRVAVAT
jgi:hypothetical protein